MIHFCGFAGTQVVGAVPGQCKHNTQVFSWRLFILYGHVVVNHFCQAGKLLADQTFGLQIDERHMPLSAWLAISGAAGSEQLHRHAVQLFGHLHGTHLYIRARIRL